MSNPVKLAFPGNVRGEFTAIAAPSRKALIESAKQWTTAARERAHEAIAAGTEDGADMTYIIGCLGHVLRILDEAAS